MVKNLIISWIKVDQVCHQRHNKIQIPVSGTYITEKKILGAAPSSSWEMKHLQAMRESTKEPISYCDWMWWQDDDRQLQNKAPS